MNTTTRPTILIVDDDEMIRQLLCSILESDYQIRIAHNGIDALRSAQQTPLPDLILLDILMPGLDGYEVCKRLKKNTVTADIPVMFISAVGDEASEYHGLQLGAEDYLIKPINPALARLRITKTVNNKLYQERLRLSAKVIENANEGVLITDSQYHIIEINQAAINITGYSRADILGKTPKILQSGRHDEQFYRQMWQNIQQRGSWQGEIWNRKKSGEIYPEYLSINALYDQHNNVSHYVAVFSDITRVKQYETRLEHAAFYDALTNIPNRLLLFDRMKQALARAKREQKFLCVCYLDLDGFKQINDTLGHDAGDHVLVEISRRLVATIRTDDTIARLGGDEFVILLNNFASIDESQIPLNRILEQVRRPIMLSQSMQLGASIGVTVYPHDQADPETMLRHADQAMYQAKQNGKNRYCYYPWT